MGRFLPACVALMGWKSKIRVSGTWKMFLLSFIFGVTITWFFLAFIFRVVLSRSCWYAATSCTI